MVWCVLWSDRRHLPSWNSAMVWFVLGQAGHSPTITLLSTHSTHLNKNILTKTKPTNSYYTLLTTLILFVVAVTTSPQNIILSICHFYFYERSVH